MSKSCETGDNGWSPILGLESKDGQYYLKVVNWKGGTGCKPSFPVYIGEYGYVNNIGEAKPIDVSQGLQGPQGYQGYQGSAGIVGPQGIQGDSIVGPQGYQGNQGSQGERGVQGLQGIVGAQGKRGYQGPRGVQGSTGLQGAGPQGSQGEQGPQGHQGNDGLQGDSGLQGPQGINGLQGTQGNQGPQGEPGEPGQAGVSGSIGPQGATGLQGAQGPQGVQGFQGDSGTSNIVGAILTLLYHNATYVLYNNGNEIYSPRLGGERWGISVASGILINRAFLRITIRGHITKNTSQNPTLFLNILQGGTSSITVLDGSMVDAVGAKQFYFETVIILKGLNGIFAYSRKTTLTEYTSISSTRGIISSGNAVTPSVDFRNTFQLRMTFDIAPDSNNSYLVDDILIEQATFQYEENEE